MVEDPRPPSLGKRLSASGLKLLCTTSLWWDLLRAESTVDKAKIMNAHQFDNSCKSLQYGLANCRISDFYHPRALGESWQERTHIVC